MRPYRHAAAYIIGVGAQIPGSGTAGLHAFADDPEWRGWRGAETPFRGYRNLINHESLRESSIPPFVDDSLWHRSVARVQDSTRPGLVPNSAVRLRCFGRGVQSRDASLRLSKVAATRKHT